MGVCERQREETYTSEWRVTLVAFDLASGDETDLLPEFDNWPWPGLCAEGSPIIRVQVAGPRFIHRRLRSLGSPAVSSGAADGDA
jgi:hypothetical protein